MTESDVKFFYSEAKHIRIGSAYLVKGRSPVVVCCASAPGGRVLTDEGVSVLVQEGTKICVKCEAVGNLLRSDGALMGPITGYVTFECMRTGSSITWQEI